MDQLKQVPGFRRWKKDRKHFIRILLVMSLSFFLMEFSFLLGDSLETTLDQRRKAAYGEWQFALLNLDASLGESHTMDANPFFAHSGYIWSQAMLTGDNLDGEYGVGGIDEDAVDISGIQLVEGRLPQSAGEAAIEASLLNYLGGSGELGETIHLELSSVDVNGKRIKDADMTPMDITVCGIISDYTANWCISNRALLPAILMTRDSFSGWESESYQCLLMLGDPDWNLNEMEDDLRSGGLSVSAEGVESKEEMSRRLSSLDRKLVRNTYTYPKAPVDDIGTVMDAVRMLSGFLAMVILGITVLTSVNSRQEEWRSLTLLGASRQRLKSLLLQEALGFGLLSMILGVCGALLGFALLMPLSSSILGFPLSYGFSWLHLLTAVGIGCGMVAVSYLIPFLRMRKLSRLHVMKKKRKKTGRLRRGRAAGRVTFATLWLRQWQTHPWLTVVQLVIMCGILVFPGIGIRKVNDQLQYVNAEIRYYGNSYTLMPESSTLDADDGILKEDLEKVSLLYGISGYDAYQYIGDSKTIQVDVSGWSGTPYQQTAAENQRMAYQNEAEAAKEEYEAWKQETGDGGADEDLGYAYEQAVRIMQAQLEEKEQLLAQGKIATRILALDSEAALQPFLDNLDRGDVNTEDFFAGRSVILALPAQVIEDDEYLEMFYISSSVLTKEAQESDIAEGKTVIYEDTISPGVSLDIFYQPDGGKSEMQTARVDGILTSMPAMDSTQDRLNLILPEYGVICSSAFLKQFSWPGIDRYQGVRVNASMEAGYGTDTQAAKMLSDSSGLYFENHREKITQLRQELYLDLILYSALCGMGMLLLLVILSGTTKNATQY